VDGGSIGRQTVSRTQSYTHFFDHLVPEGFAGADMLATMAPET
jgi:hypothetical protein